MTTADDELMWDRLGALRVQVRDALTRAEEAALLAQSKEPAADAALREAVRRLVEIPRTELSVEDGEMIPVLTLADGWGPIRAFYLREDLASERARGACRRRRGCCAQAARAGRRRGPVARAEPPAIAAGGRRGHRGASRTLSDRTNCARAQTVRALVVRVSALLDGASIATAPA